MSNTPVFPGRVATASDLFIASNGTSTDLIVGIADTATSATVPSTAGFNAPCLATIDSEIVAIYSVSGGNTLHFGVSSADNIDGRGIDGTVAASHLAGRTVQIRVVAWHHNQMSAEVIAAQAEIARPKVLPKRIGGALAGVASIKSGGTAPLVIAMFGDSWTANQTYTTPFSRRLQQTLGSAGPGYVMLDGVDGAPLLTTLTTTGAWTNAASIYSPYTAATSSVDFATPAQKSIVATATRFVIGYRGGGGVFRYQVDSGAWTSVNTAAQTGNQFVTISGLSLANHTLAIQPVSGAAVTLFGVDCQVPSVAGVRTEVFAKSGQTAQVFASLDTTALATNLAQTAPNLITVLLGINDWSVAGRTASQFQADLTTFVANLQAAAPAASIILTTQADSGYANPNLYVPFVQAIQAVAYANGLTCVDLWDALGPFLVNGVQNPYGIFNGGLHPSLVGGYVIAESLLGYLPGSLENPALRANLSALASVFGFLNLLNILGGIVATGPGSQAVALNGATNPSVTVTDTDGTVTKLQTAGGQGFLGTQSAAALNILTNNATAIFIDAAGNITALGKFVASGAAGSITLDASVNPNAQVTDGTGIVKLQIGVGSAGFVGTETSNPFSLLAHNVPAMTFTAAGAPSLFAVPGPYANNAAAIAAGLAAGALYRNADVLQIVH